MFGMFKNSAKKHLIKTIRDLDALGFLDPTNPQSHAINARKNTIWTRIFDEFEINSQKQIVEQPEAITGLYIFTKNLDRGLPIHTEPNHFHAVIIQPPYQIEMDSNEAGAQLAQLIPECKAIGMGQY